MCDYVKEAIFLEEGPNCHIIKEEVVIEEGRDVEVVKEEREEADKALSKGHKCAMCSKTFKSQCGYSSHYMRMHSREHFACELCGCKYHSKMSLKKHLEMHSREKIYKCSECGYATKRKRDLIKHIKILHPAEVPSQQCEEGSTSVSTLWLLKEYSLNHKEEKPYKCDQCSTAYNRKTSLNDHKATVHNNIGKFACDACGKKFLYRTQLQEHMQKHSKEKNYKCADCGCAFKSKGVLRRHVSTLHPSVTPFQCEVCSKSFSKLSHLKKHSVNHDKLKRYTCDQCHMAYKRKPTLVYHKAMVHGSEGKFSCEECGKKFANRTHLKLHLETHSDLRKHKCPECGCTFKIKGNLTRHVKTLHPASTTFRCEVCSESFGTRSLLETHSRIHNETKPYKCDRCPTAYYNKSHLDAHKAAAHNDEGKFPCEVCGKDFLLPTGLKEHVEKYTNDKKCCKCGEVNGTIKELIRHIYANHCAPFQCKVCLKNFGDLSLLKVHSLTHSDDTPYKCDLCLNEYKAKRFLDQHVERVHSAPKKGVLMVGDIKVEPIEVYDPEEKQVYPEVKVEVKREPDEIDTD